MQEISEKAKARALAPSAVTLGFISKSDAVNEHAPRKRALTDEMLLRISSDSDKVLDRFFDVDFPETQFEKVSLPQNMKLGDAATAYLKKLGGEMAAKADAGHVALYCRIKFNTFNLDPTQDVILRFNGIEPYAKAYINGHFAFEITDGFLPAEFAVNELLKKGENLLALKIYPFGTGLCEWTERSVIGVFQSIDFIKRPKSRFTDIYVHTEFEDEKPTLLADLSVAVESDAALGNGGTVECELYDENGRLVCESKAPTRVFGRHSFKVIRLALSCDELKEWSPQNPQIYSLVATLRRADGKYADLQMLKCGVSRCAVERVTQNKDVHAKLIHNQKGVKLYGAVFEGHDLDEGFDMDSELIEKRLKLLKDNGFNAVRLTAPSERILSVCDKIGLFVSLVCPLSVPAREKRNKDGKHDPVFRSLERLASMIAQYKNHPSVILYELSCREPYPLATYANLAKTLDDTRPVLSEGDFTFGVSDIFAASDCTSQELAAIGAEQPIPDASSGLIKGMTRDYTAFPFLLTAASKNADLVERFGIINAYDNLAGAFSERLELTSAALAPFKSAFDSKSFVVAAQTKTDRKTNRGVLAALKGMKKEKARAASKNEGESAEI